MKRKRCKQMKIWMCIYKNILNLKENEFVDIYTAKLTTNMSIMKTNGLA